MTSFTVSFRPQVFDDLDGIPKNIQKRILNAVETRLTQAPRDYGTRLSQSLASLWKLRVGDYRVVFEIHGDQVTVWAILHRKNVYQEVSKRWLA